MGTFGKNEDLNEMTLNAAFIIGPAMFAYFKDKMIFR